MVKKKKKRRLGVNGDSADILASAELPRGPNSSLEAESKKYLAIIKHGVYVARQYSYDKKKCILANLYPLQQIEKAAQLPRFRNSLQ